MKGVPETDAGVEAQKSMQSCAARALASANALIREAVGHTTIVQAGGKVVSGDSQMVWRRDGLPRFRLCA